MALAVPLFAQTPAPPRPRWMDFPPSSSKYKFFFKSAVATASNPEDARNSAFSDAYVQGMQRSGLTLGEGAKISDIKKKGIDAFMQSQSTNGLAVNIYCEEVVKQQGHYTAYVLLQIANSAAEDPRFDDAEAEGDICKTQEFAARRDEYRKALTNNKYFAWGIVNVGFPLNVGTTFMGRFGRTIGIGFQASVGTDIGFPDGGDIACFLSYSAGLKLFPYGNIFLSANYGTIGCQKVIAYNDEDGYFASDGVRQATGFSFTIGYDLVPYRERSSFLLSAQAGGAYDTFTSKWYSQIKLSIGVAWNFK
jgi:hypothetical protein